MTNRRLGNTLATAAFTAALAACGGGDDNAPQSGRTMGNQTAPKPAATSSSDSNTPPTVVDVTLRPDEPRTGEKVTAVVETRDVEGDPVKLDFRWSVGDEPSSGTGETLLLRRATKGDIVQVIVTARDSHGSSQPYEASVIVGNQAPVIRGVVFEPLGEVSVGDDVTAAPRALDADHDEVTFEYEWAVNGSFVSNEATLSAREFRRGDRIVLTVVAYDGEDRSEPLVSDPVEVINAAPQIVSDPAGFDGESFQYQIEVEDPDNDRSFRFHLEEGPRGMKLDHLSGIVTWQPSSDQAGRHPVKIRVEDRRGGSDVQAFELTLGFETAESPASPSR